MSISKERRDRFTSQASDFVIVKPAPKKNTAKVSNNKAKADKKPTKKK